MQQVLLGRRRRKQKNLPLLALSLRDLGYGITPFVVQVRRSIDGLTQNFTAGELRNGTLTSFCGAGDGFASIWYEQLGNFNFIQPNPSQQPRLVQNGVLETIKGEPIMRAVNTGTTMYNVTYGIQNFKAVVVASNSNISTLALFSDYINRSNYTFIASTGSSLTSIHRGSVINDERIDGDVFNYTTRDDVYQAFNNQQRLLSFTANLSFRVNGRALGYSPTDRPLPMYDMQEMIHYPPTFTGIIDAENAVNAYYNIY